MENNKGAKGFHIFAPSIIERKTSASASTIKNLQ